MARPVACRMLSSALSSTEAKPAAQARPEALLWSSMALRALAFSFWEPPRRARHPRLGGDRRDMVPDVLDGASVHEAPDPGRELAPPLAQVQVEARAADRGLDLGLRAHNAGIGQQAAHIRLAEARHRVRVEV